MQSDTKALTWASIHNGPYHMPNTFRTQTEGYTSYFYVVDFLLRITLQVSLTS